MIVCDYFQLYLIFKLIFFFFNTIYISRSIKITDNLTIIFAKPTEPEGAGSGLVRVSSRVVRDAVTAQVSMVTRDGRGLEGTVTITIALVSHQHAEAVARSFLVYAVKVIPSSKEYIENLGIKMNRLILKFFKESNRTGKVVPHHHHRAGVSPRR